MSKKFKDTKLGTFLGNAAPHILDIAGDLLPDAGVLGMVKKIALAKTREMYELEVKDRDSARSREVEVKKAGSKDIMMMLTGIVGLLSFMFIIYAVVYEEGVLHNELFVHLMGMIEGVVISNIFAYYYGTSAEK